MGPVLNFMDEEKYGLIIIGTGSAMNLVEPFLSRNPGERVAVIDKDEPGGICLTRGCIPSKILLHSAEMVREIEKAKDFGIDARIENIDFDEIMRYMREHIDGEIEAIGNGLKNAEGIDYYKEIASFVAPYTLKVGDKIIKSDTIFLCTGSKPFIPPIKGIEKVEYHTSDTILHIKNKPESMIIVGGGYIAAEYGHFFSSMGTDVTIVGRNSRFLPKEEREISSLAVHELSKHMEIHTGYEVKEAWEDGMKKIVAVNRETGERKEFEGEMILIAAGRAPNTDILHPDKGGIKTDSRGWIVVDEYMQTSQPGVWAMGDATGKHLFKHVANYESEIVYYNAILGKKVKVDYHAVPHAVFTYPEIAGVGMGEREAVEKYGDDVLIGFYRYEDTGMGLAMKVKDYFVKIITERKNFRLLGAHIIGNHASILIHEVINLMYTNEQSAYPIYASMHIHPSLSEVVQRAIGNLMSVEEYHHMLKHYGLED